MNGKKVLKTKIKKKKKKKKKTFIPPDSSLVLFEGFFRQLLLNIREIHGIYLKHQEEENETRIQW